MPWKVSLDKFNWSAVNPIRYVAGSSYLIAETEHRDEPKEGGLLSSAFKATAYKGFLLKGHLKYTKRQAHNVETAELGKVSMLSLQVCKSASLQVCKSAGLQVCKSASLQVCRSASLQVCKSAGLQVWRSAGL